MSRPGRVVIERFESRVLRGNAAGDPHVRDVPVYLPPSYDHDESRRFPVVFVLSGFAGRGRMLLNDNPWSPPLDVRMDRLIAAGCAEAILVMPDAFTRYGGSQYLNSSATGRYEDHVIEELVPHVDARWRTLGSRDHRAVAGRSSGGYGALVLAMRHPDVFGAAASHSGDVYFEYCYRPELPRACTVMQEAGGAKAFLEAFEARPQKGKDDFLAFNALGMAASYSPDPAAELGIALPFDLATGAFRENVWNRWLEHDPLVLLPRHEAALRSLRLLYLDCGTRDEYHLHHGARMLAAALGQRGIAHVHEEFADGHMNVNYRWDSSLPRLIAAISA